MVGRKEWEVLRIEGLKVIEKVIKEYEITGDDMNEEFGYYN